MSFTGSTPQFNTAEYSSAEEVCKSCKQPIAGEYYRINGMLACASCSSQVRQQAPKDTHTAFARGIAFGIGGAVLGFILFAGFVIITGISLGYISLAVGYLVGKAMKMGSGGIGGRRYQIVAAALTYAAVSMAAVPIAIHYYRAGKTAHVQSKAPSPAAAPSAPATPKNERPADTTIVVQADPPSKPPVQAPPARPKKSLAQVAGQLVMVGLASPFLELSEPFQGLIGLIILAVGINIAWKLTAGPKLEILGPFRASAVGTLPTSAV
jgi:hypothetical protein